MLWLWCINLNFSCRLPKPLNLLWILSNWKWLRQFFEESVEVGIFVSFSFFCSYTVSTHYCIPLRRENGSTWSTTSTLLQCFKECIFWVIPYYFNTSYCNSKRINQSNTFIEMFIRLYCNSKFEQNFEVNVKRYITTSNDRSFGCLIIYMDIIHNATLFIEPHQCLIQQGLIL